ncbi:hypothetical protein ElyMa_005384400, partial [Elysia marginata]
VEVVVVTVVVVAVVVVVIVVVAVVVVVVVVVEEVVVVVIVQLQINVCPIIHKTSHIATLLQCDSDRDRTFLQNHTHLHRPDGSSCAAHAGPLILACQA